MKTGVHCEKKMFSSAQLTNRPEGMDRIIITGGCLVIGSGWSLHERVKWERQCVNGRAVSDAGASCS